MKPSCYILTGLKKYRGGKTHSPVILRIVELDLFEGTTSQEKRLQADKVLGESAADHLFHDYENFALFRASKQLEKSFFRANGKELRLEHFTVLPSTAKRAPIFCTKSEFLVVQAVESFNKKVVSIVESINQTRAAVASAITPSIEPVKQAIRKLHSRKAPTL